MKGHMSRWVFSLCSSLIQPDRIMGRDTGDTVRVDPYYRFLA